MHSVPARTAAVLRLALALSLISSAGCGTLLLRADFESDDLDDPPSRFPEGPPADDQVHSCIEMTPEGDFVFPAVEQRGDTRLLNFSNAQRGCGVLFSTIPTPEDRGDDYWFWWTGIAELDLGEDVEINIGRRAYPPAVTFRFRGVENGLVEVLARSSAPEVRIGLVPKGTLHALLVRLNRPAWQYTASVIGGPRTETQPPRPISNDAWSSDSPSDPMILQLAVDAGASAGGSYLIDLVTASVSCPDATGDPEVCEM